MEEGWHSPHTSGLYWTGIGTGKRTGNGNMAIESERGRNCRREEERAIERERERDPLIHHLFQRALKQVIGPSTKLLTGL